MSARETISKKVRFDVFKRDFFTCQYCGKTPPGVVLEVDHIHPVSKGGKNVIDNLLTSCFDCNRGKSDGLLSSIPETLKVRNERLREHEDQIKAYNKTIKAKIKRENEIIAQIEKSFQDTYGDYSFKPVFRESIRRNFVPYIQYDQLLSAIIKAISVTKNAGAATKYFCGICWNIRRSGEK